MNYFLESLSGATRLIATFDPEIYRIMWVSLKVSFIASVIAAILGVPSGFFLAMKTFPGKKFVLQILNTLMALPTVVVGLLFYGILSRRGILGDWGLLYTQTAMVMGLCVLILPVMTNLSVSAAKSADKRMYPTCLSLGANEFQQGILFFNEVRFAVLAAIVAGFGRAIGEVGVAMMLGGNIQGFTRTMTTAIALETSKGEFEFALALGMLLLLLAFAINGLLLRFQQLNK